MSNDASKGCIKYTFFQVTVAHKHSLKVSFAEIFVVSTLMTALSLEAVQENSPLSDVVDLSSGGVKKVGRQLTVEFEFAALVPESSREGFKFTTVDHLPKLANSKIYVAALHFSQTDEASPFHEFSARALRKLFF